MEPPLNIDLNESIQEASLLSIIFLQENGIYTYFPKHMFHKPHLEN